MAKGKSNYSNNSMKKYEERQKRLNTGARIMAIVVALAMVVTTFLAAGVFFWD